MKKFLCLVGILFFLYNTTPGRSFSQTETPAKQSFCGIGVFLDVEDGNLIVLSTIKDSPAYKSGIKVGDIIEKIDGITYDKLDHARLNEVQEKIRGPEGTRVSLTILNGKKKREVAVTRSQVKLDKADWTKSIGFGSVMLAPMTVRLCNITSDEIGRLNRERAEHKKSPQPHRLPPGVKSEDDMKEIERFIGEAKEALKYHNYKSILGYLVTAYSVTERYELASETAMEFSKILPKSPVPMINALTLLQLDETRNYNNHFEKMMAMYGQYVKKFPKEPGFRRYLADHFLFTSGRYKEAVRFYEEILEIAPAYKDLEIYQKLGAAYKLAGNKEKAQTTFEEGIRRIESLPANEKEKNENLLKTIKTEMDLLKN